MNATLPQSHPYIATTNDVEKVFGSKYVAVIGITPKTGDIYQPKVIEKIRRISDELARTPGINSENLLSLTARRVKSISSAGDGIEVRSLVGKSATESDMRWLRAAMATNPVYLDSIVSRDGRTASVIVEFKEPADGFRSILDKVNDIVQKERDETIEIHIGGLPSYLAAIEHYSERMAILLPIAIGVLSIVLYAGFRTTQGPILPLLTAMIAVAWGVGVMGAFGIPMDVFNATTPILILAVATGHAVQMLKRYYEEYHRLQASGLYSPQEANRQAVVTSLGRVGPVMIIAGMVASLGFFSLVAFDISTVRTFGIFTGIGILAAMILEMSFIPAVRSLLPPPKSEAAAGSGGVWIRFAGGIANLVIRRRRITYVAFVLAGGLSLAGLDRLMVDNSVKSFFSEDNPISIEDRQLNEKLGGTNTMYVLIESETPNAVKNPETLKAMDSLQKYLEQKPYVGKTVSLAYFVQRMNQAMHADDPSYFSIPVSEELVSQYLMLYSMSGDPGDFDSYVDYDYRKANITIYLKTDSSAYIEELVKEVNAFARANFANDIKVRVGGSVPQSAALSEVMVHGKLMNIVQIGVVVFLISAIVFRSIIGGFLVLLPLLVAVVANFAVMGWSGILLNVPTSLTSAMAVGIGADYAIYLIYRLREELADGADENSAVRRTIATAGQAVLFVALAVATGYGVLLLSFGFKIHQWLAILIAVAMIVSALAALFLIPMLILSFRPQFIFKSKPMTSRSKPSIAALAAITFLLGMYIHPQNARAAEADVAMIMEKNFAVTRVEDSVFEATFTLTNKNGNERIRRTTGATRLQSNGRDQMRFTRFVSPPDVKGTTSLLIEHEDHDDDIWIYLPALKKVRRLVSNNKKDSFLGTDFSYADVIGYRVSDWSYRLLHEETVDGEQCYVISAVPKTNEIAEQSGYSKRMDWVRKNSHVTVKSHYWDGAGQLLKISTFGDFRQVDPKRNKWQAMRLESGNVLTGHRTVIQFDSFKVNQNVDEQMFTTRHMEKQ